MFCVKLWDVERGAAQIAPLVAAWRRRRSRSRTASTAPAILTRAVGRRHTCSAASRTSRRRSARRASSRTPARWRACASARSPAGRLAARAQAFVDACTARGYRRRALARHPARAVGEVRASCRAVRAARASPGSRSACIRTDPDLRATFEARCAKRSPSARAQGVALAGRLRRAAAARARRPAGARCTRRC